jgi:hypothetical protein
MLSYPCLPMSFNYHGRTLLFPCLFFLPPVLATTQLACATTPQPAPHGGVVGSRGNGGASRGGEPELVRNDTPSPGESTADSAGAPPAPLPIFAVEKRSSAPWPVPAKEQERPSLAHLGFVTNRRPRAPRLIHRLAAPLYLHQATQCGRTARLPHLLLCIRGGLALRRPTGGAADGRRPVAAAPPPHHLDATPRLDSSPTR